MDPVVPSSEEHQPHTVKAQTDLAGNGNTSSKSSTKKHVANRRNALRSTGPRTAAGQQRVRWNAMKHGLLAQDVLLPSEDAAAFKDLARRVQSESGPVGAEEEALVERMITCLWRLRRLTRVENGILTYEYFSILAARAGWEARSFERSENDDLRQLYPKPILDKAKHQQAVAKQKEMTHRANADIPTLGRAFVRGISDEDALSKLARYEASLERSYYRALHELQRRQVARQGGHVTPPLALDVTMTSDGGPSA